MARVVSAAEAKAKFSELAAKVAHSRERVLIERHGKPYAALVSPADLQRLEAMEPSGERPQGLLALRGIWSDVDQDDLDKVIRDIYASRKRDMGRKVELEP